MIKFDSKTKIVLSEDLAGDVRFIVKEEGCRNVIAVLDGNIVGHDSVRKMLSQVCKDAAVREVIVRATEPTTDMVNEYAGKLREEKADIFIGVGGGSILDLTKALSVMVANEGKVENYHGTGKPFISGIKKIMVPTTAGTGSEVTGGAVLVNKDTKFKRAIGGNYVVPDYAVLNAPLTLTMPDSVAASTGMDALGHAIESYTARCANDLTRMYSKEAFRLVYNNLPKIFNDRSDILLRRKILLGATLAGYAIYNSNTGACHSMSYALGLYNDIPHGVAVAYLLSSVVSINVDKGCYLYSDLYDLIEGAEKDLSEKEKALRFSLALKGYKPLSYIEKRFSDYGINAANQEFLAEQGLRLTPALSNNPVDFRLEEARKALVDSL